ncbi:MAG: hypothetical protein R2795_11605 [Saprospiraceae bacterium]
MACENGSRIPLANLARHYNIHTVFLMGINPEQAGIQAQLPPYTFIKVGSGNYSMPTVPKPYARSENSRKTKKRVPYGMP